LPKILYKKLNKLVYYTSLYYTSSVIMTLATLVVAEIINGFPPVAMQPAPHATKAVHNTGYLITGGVQFRTIFLTPIVKAPDGDVVL